MADQNRNIASPAPAANSPQPGFVPDAGIFPPGKGNAELSNTVGDALAALGVGGDLPQSKKVEKPKKPKAEAEEEPEAESDDEAEEETESEVEDEESETEEEDESEAESEEESEAEDEESEAEDTSKKDTRDKRRERFEKLTAKLREKDEQLKERDDRLAELEEQLEQSSAARTAPTAANPLADVEDETSLNARLQQARRLQRWCAAQMRTDDEGKQIYMPGKPPGAERELTAAEVEGYLYWADTVIDTAPAHLKVIAKLEENRAQAKAKYPTMFERGHSDAARRTDLLKEITGPNRDLLIGRILRAEAEEKREAEGKGRFVFMPLKPDGTAPKAKPKENGNGHTRQSTPAAQPVRTPVTAADKTPKRKLSAALESGQPVSAEALVFGG